MTLAAAVSTSRPRSELRSRIVDAAWSVGSEGREDTLTIRGIAVRAGVSPALLYTYFENKGALIIEMQQLALPALRTALAEAVDGVEDAQERLQRACVAYVEFARAHRWLYETKDGGPDGAANGLTDAFHVLIVELLGALGREQPERSAQLLRVAITGLIAAEPQGPRTEVTDETRAFAESYVRMLLRGI